VSPARRSPTSSDGSTHATIRPPASRGSSCTEGELWNNLTPTRPFCFFMFLHWCGQGCQEMRASAEEEATSSIARMCATGPAKSSERPVGGCLNQTGTDG